MKIIGKTLIAGLFAISAFCVMPLAAQTAQQKANEINAAGKSAAQSQSAEESRSINNAAWDGSQGGSGTSFDGGVIDPIGGNAPEEKKDESSVPETSESENVTPWEGEMDAIKGLLGGILGALALAAIFLDADTMASCVAGIVFCAAAIGMCIAMIAISMVIMIKYKQAAMGSVWLATATALLGLSIFAMVSGIKNGKRIKANAGAVNDATASSLKTLTKFLGVIGVGGGFMDAYSDKINEKTEKKEDKKDSGSGDNK
ncbi:MAG: hypothetical protein J5706_03075 [Elusimicrobiales bacterium]|nr:hypothetical protein [Elusimicrobiales bacterium]